MPHLHKIRVWAAAVRDRKDIPSEQAATARTVCTLIDLRQRCLADNVRNDLEHTIALLVGRLAIAGLSPSTN